MKMEKISISTEQKDMLESMPQTVAIGVMLTLAVNLIRAVNGKIKSAQLPDDPIKLIAEISLITVLAGAVPGMDHSPVEQSEMH